MPVDVVPTLETATAAIHAWVSDNPDLAGWLASGMVPADALARWGTTLMRAHRWADAAAVFQAALAFNAESPVVWTNLGISLDRVGAFEEAEYCLNRSVAMQPRQPDTWLLLGLVRKKRGDAIGCERAYRTALQLEPHSAVVWQCLGLLKEEQRDYPAAIDAFASCTTFGPPNPAVSANLGKLCYQLGRFREAFMAYSAAVTGQPDNAHYKQILRKARFLHEVLEGASPDDALAIYRQAATATETDRETAHFFEAACSQLSSFGHVDAALRVIERRLALWPASATAEYLRQALHRDPQLERSPPAYIVESFDAFAESFDAKLVGILGYDVPEKICALVRVGIDRPEALAVLDAGCGTGLCGPGLRPIARQLTGLDLSPKMLEQSARRGAYDALVCDDLVLYLGRSPAGFDLIVAADVIIYFGDLTAVAASAAVALRPGGWLAFSHEHLEGEGYAIQPSGRFSHAPPYVRSAFAEAFVEERCVETTIRLEAGHRVRGNLFLFRRR